jgi:RNA 2',3'-cyclic 3'-phosphodiesterase
MQNSQIHRLFIAFSLPEKVKCELEKAQTDLRSAIGGDCVRWARREQFHLTLKFLGNVEAQRLDDLYAPLCRTCAAFPALQFRAERIGFFPDARHPRVVWVGVRDQAGLLARLHQDVEGAVKEFTRQKAEGYFAGHVTLGRCKSIKRAWAEVLAQAARGMSDRVFGEWTADRVEVVHSDLSSRGSSYTTLTVIPLASKSGQPVPSAIS